VICFSSSKFPQTWIPHCDMSVIHMIDYKQHSAHNYALNAWDLFLIYFLFTYLFVLFIQSSYMGP